MKNYIKNLFLKVMSLVLVLFLTLPSQIFASTITTRDDKAYNGNKSIMGLAGLSMTSDDDVTDKPIENNQVLASDKSTRETDDFLIEKSAGISKTTGLITYKIALTNKAKTSHNNQSLVFATNSNLSDLKVDKVTAISNNGHEREIAYEEKNPSILNRDKDIETFGISAESNEDTTIYYICAKLSDDALKSLEQIVNSDDIFAIDYAILDGEEALYQERYSLKVDNQNSSEHFALLEDEDSTNNINATYIAESSNIFGHSPATISYTDFILAKDNQEFIYKLQLDENQSTENSQINIDFYQAKEEGYVINKTFSQNIPFTKELKLQIPNGQFAKVNFTSTVKENANPQNFTFNNKTIANPGYKITSSKEEESNEEEDSLPDNSFDKEARANSSDDSIAQDKDQDFSVNSNIEKAETSTDNSFNNKPRANLSNDSITQDKDQDFSSNSNTKKEDPTIGESSNNESGSNSSNDIIADDSDLDFSANSKSEDQVSAIAINKDGYLAKLNNESRLTNDLEEATNDITSELEAYNNDEIYLDELQASIGKISSKYNLDSSQVEEIINALISGLNEEKHKVAKLNVNDIDKAIASNDGQRKVEKALAGPDANIPADYLDRLVSEKLQEEGITIEDFQNYMYELEEKYGLKNEDVDRVYTENEEAIKKLISKAQEEKNTGDVFAADNQSAFRKTYPYKTNYWTYQYYDQTKKTVNWDIRIETDQIKPSHLEYNNVGLSLYAPVTQGLTNFKVTVKDNLSDVSTNDNAKKVRERSDNGTITFANNTLEKDGNLYKFNLNIPKGKLPNDLIIHVEATPKDDHAKYQMYDLGLRLTPDNNYINDKVKEFKEDWARLVSLMPWILPYKSGEAAAERFADGFNLVDTRLPADAMVAAYKDDHHKAKSYTDKSRSVFGEFTTPTSNQINWQISDTLRLQDDDRFVSNGKLGEDIFATVFNSNNNTSENVSVEVLEPKKDGTFKQIHKGNYGSDSDFRKALSGIKATLIPGTVINYNFSKIANNPTVDSTATTNFSERFDNGFGTYGGEQTATLRRLTEKEESSIVHVAQYNGDSRWMIVRENGEFALCINYGKQYPIIRLTGDNLKIHQKNIKDATIDDLNNYAGYYPSIDSNGLYKDRAKRNKARMYDEIKRALYLVENTDFKSEEEKYYVAQILMFRIIDIYTVTKMVPNPDDAYNENTRVGQTVISGNLPSESGLYTQIANPFVKHKEKANEIFRKIPETKKESSNYYISSADVNEAVEINIYPTFEDGTGNKKDFQTVISYKAKNPLRINKVDSDNRPISGVSFNISGNGKNITYTSGNEPNKFYLPVGKYTVTETNTPQGYNKIEPFTIEVTEETNSVERAWYDSRRNQRGSTTYYYPSNTAVISENNNYFVDQNGERKSLVNIESKYINDFKEYQSSLNIINTKGRLEVSKKLLAADGEYHELAGIKFTLKENGIFNLTKKEATTNSKGIAVFDNLPLNSEWTLEEVKMEGLSEVYTKWNVKVDSTGKVTITANRDSKDPDNLFTIDPSDSSKITVINEPDIKGLGNFKIKKVDQEGKPLGNAGFTLYKSDKSTVVKSKNSNSEEYFTDDNGNLYYSNIPDGIYYLKETTPPKGYTRASTSEWTSISIRNSNVNIVDGDIAPDQIDQYVRFGNADETVSVKSIDGGESSLEVDSNGNVNIFNLDDGQYELSQNNNKITVHIKDGKLTRSYQGGFVTNNPDQPSTNDQSLVKVSADLTQALVRYPNDNKSNAYPSGGYIDISRWANGTYKIEDEIAKELITIEVIDGKLAKSPIRSDLYETVTTRNWKSDLDYQRDANYPDYMNMKDYVELTDYDSGELTSYILLKPDNKIAGGNGTDKNTIFNIMASNANIKSVEIFDIGGDYYKAGPNASMDDQSMGSYINDYNMQGTNETRDRKDKTYITIDGQRRGSVYNTYSNSVKISIPASRFGEDWSYLIRVKSNIYNKDYGSTISHHWVTDNDTLGEAYLKKDFDVPAYKDLTETRKVATIIEDSKNLASNVINNIKDGLLGSLVQTAYAAETSDFSKVEISHKPNGASDYIEYTVVNVIDNVDVSFTKYSICKDSNGEDYTQILPGAEFKLQILKDNQFVDTDKTARSDSSGQVKFEGLTAGEYQLIETTVPDGYRNPGGPVKKFTVKMTENGLKAFINGTEELIYSGNNANNYIYNERKGKGELKVTKKGETSELLNGAEFTLYRFEFKDSGDSIATITTGKDGEKGVAHFTELPYGKYWLVETKSPDGYIRNPEPRLITISHKYYVPETAGKDVSSQLTLNRDSDHLPSIRSSSGSEYVVYPNSAEGLKANLNYKVDQNANIQPGDYFYASTSDNLDIGGIFDDNSFAKAGGLDIVGSQGTIAKAKVETIDGKSYIKYMFTDYVSNRRLNDINLYIPMFVDRYKVRNSTGNTSIPLPIPLEVGIAIPGQTQNKEKHVL